VIRSWLSNPNCSKPFSRPPDRDNGPSSASSRPGFGTESVTNHPRKEQADDADWLVHVVFDVGPRRVDGAVFQLHLSQADTGSRAGSSRLPKGPRSAVHRHGFGGSAPSGASVLTVSSLTRRRQSRNATSPTGIGRIQVTTR
jgi:hypothetical protein